MRKKRFFSSGEKLEARRKKLDAIAIAKGEKTEKEMEEWWKVKRYDHQIELEEDADGYWTPKPPVRK